MKRNTIILVNKNLMILVLRIAYNFTLRYENMIGGRKPGYRIARKTIKLSRG
jgi:hypothetical protein